LLNPERAHPEALAALRRSGGRVAACHEVAVGEADVVLDGIVGLSARGPLRQHAAALVERITAPVLAVDLPSGVDPDTGVVDGPAVRARETVTFGGRKPGLVLGEGAVRSGRVHVVDIGLDLPAPDLNMLQAADVGKYWPVPGPDSDKYSQGVLGVAAGSARYPGAAVLSTGGAVLATSGMVRFAGPAAEAVLARWPEVIATGTVADVGRVQGWMVGPGLGTGDAAREVLTRLLDTGVPVCLDADALTVLARFPQVLDARQPGTPLVLTPHAGEFARLAGEVGADRVAAARAAARRFDAVLLLKGHTTVVAAPDGRVLVNPRRSAWPATAGSGDVLSGILGALLACGLDPWLAAGCAAYVHSLAADLAAGGAPAPASRILEGIPAAIRTVRLC
ncbi:MAG: NAD(P)H-hydrate dehydratase, partial [Sciscionella sp.]